ncbi:MAG TPA: Holliday junction resolvase RuvX [Candidatus Saccharibacteria bacterium]|nr:Holliday junction resolvase RuvX [Candidatus Saccharibacteria bacterium]HMR38264.1 Holliday junction resolvase RuvX [Candidatus Saccharibacteria bacterium]
MAKIDRVLGLDVGEKRIGVAEGDTGVRIAIPSETILVDGREVEEITRLVLMGDISTIVVGYPRNQQGETTKQTEFVETFVDKLRDLDVKIVFQDESLTSVLAENRLKSLGKPYGKEDIDALAASIILEDYLEQL